MPNGVSTGKNKRDKTLGGNMKKVLLVFIIFFLAGCSYGKIAKRNNDLMLTLNMGQAKQEVLHVMGNPSKSEQYFRGGKQIEVWYYRTSSFETGGWNSDDYFTPMVFQDGKLVGWGKDFYSQKIESSFAINDDEVQY